MTMMSLPLDQKEQRKERSLMRLMIPSNLMTISTIECQYLWNVDYNCVLNILNATFIDRLLIENHKSIAILTSFLLAIFVFVCFVINYLERERTCYDKRWYCATSF